MTIMARLHQKGVLERRREGKTDVYKPMLDRDEFMALRAQAEVDELVAHRDFALAILRGRLRASIRPAAARCSGWPANPKPPRSVRATRRLRNARRARATVIEGGLGTGLRHRGRCG